MKVGWTTQALGEMATVGAGNPAPQDETLFVDGSHPFFRTSDAGRVRFGDITDAADYLNQKGITGLRLSPKGTILFPKSGASTFLNHRVMLAVDGFVSSHLATIQPNSRSVHGRYLLYFLATVSAQDMIQDHAYPSLKLPDISAIQVPVPPLPEQRRIAGILDGAFEGIAAAKANAEKNLQNAREVFESHLTNTFANRTADWKELHLSDVAVDFGRGKSKHRPRNDPKLYGGPYPFIQTGDVRNADHVISEYSQTYSEAGLAQSKLWPVGTLCITIAANIAETGILGFESCFPDSVIGVVVNPKHTSNKFLEYLLQSVKAVLKAQGKGSAQDNINLGTFENQTFPFPHPKVQAKLVEVLDGLREHTSRLEAIYQEKLDALDELKKSLLARAFRGEL